MDDKTSLALDAIWPSALRCRLAESLILRYRKTDKKDQHGRNSQDDQAQSPVHRHHDHQHSYQGQELGNEGKHKFDESIAELRWYRK